MDGFTKFLKWLYIFVCILAVCLILAKSLEWFPFGMVEIKNVGDTVALIIAIVFAGIPLILVTGYYLCVTAYNIVNCIIDKIKRS